jgi:DNA modification methylase
MNRCSTDFYKTASTRGIPTASRPPSGNYDKPKRNKDHPTSKPLDLLGYPIQNSSQENSVVIDTFGGSGSTLMACEQLNRICYMMELDPKYASVILRRYVEDTAMRKMCM